MSQHNKVGAHTRTVSGRGSSNVTGMHRIAGYRATGVANAVGMDTIRDAFRGPALSVRTGNIPTMCPMCSESIVTGRSGASTTTRSYDPLTGICTRTKACAKRREDLDDETIEFLGLIPRE